MRKGKLKPNKHTILIDLTIDESEQLARIAKADDRSRTSTARRAVRDFIQSRLAALAQAEEDGKK